MLLQRLKEYADQRLKLPPTLYSERPVRYIIELDRTGRLLNPEPTDTADPSSPRTKNGLRRLAPQVQRAFGIKPLLLADTAEYTLGLAREKSKPERVAECHRAYMELLERCAAEAEETAVMAVQAFLSADPLSHLALPDDFDGGATITFRADGAFPIDLPTVQAFWAGENDPAAKGASVMQCLVCGREQPVLDRLQGKIKGVPGGQTSGTSIISANAEAFESYGLEASLIAPTCAGCGERFTKAANHLLASEGSRIVLGGAAFIFWTREDVPFSFRDFVNDPQPQQVNDLLEAVRSPRGYIPKVDDTAFYATALSGSGGRAVVRDWIDTTVGEVKEHLAAWFQRQWIVDAYGEEGRPLGLYALAAATVRDARKELAPPTPRALLRSALTGTPLPPGMLYQAVRRNRAEQDVTHQRAALIKLVLLGQEPNREEDYMVQLAPNHPSPSYHCGRLLAVLEAVQRLALPGAKSTIVDRFFGTASSAPASVFGRLLRGAQSRTWQSWSGTAPAPTSPCSAVWRTFRLGFRASRVRLPWRSRACSPWATTTSAPSTAVRRGRPPSAADRGSPHCREGSLSTRQRTISKTQRRRTTNMASAIMNDVNCRHDFVLLFDVTDGNPNGDPDAGNLPRVDPETMQGLVTDVAIKRKVRDWVDMSRGDEGRFKIYIQSGGPALNAIHKRAYEAEKLTSTGTKQAKGDVDKARAWMCVNFYDIRLFGAVMTTGVNCGQVRGPVQLTFARSLDPITPLYISITRVAVTREEDAQVVVTEEGGTGAGGKQTEMGRKAIVPYGLYRAYGFFNPHFAKQTGVTEEDLGLFWQTLQNMWDTDRSASRGFMACRGLHVFSHESSLGNAPAHALFELVSVERKPSVEAPRKFSEYSVTVDETLPAGVTLTRLVG